MKVDMFVMLRKTIAGLREMEYEELAKVTYDNAVRLFRL